MRLACSLLSQTTLAVDYMMFKLWSFICIDFAVPKIEPSKYSSEHL